VGAFESAVVTRGADGRITESVKRLVDQATSVEKFVEVPASGFVVFAGARAAEAAALGEECSSLVDLAAKVKGAVLDGIGASAS
jgi:hypothetical protein